jgi:HAD superfamily hydrolase (TIGR01509 family)
MLWDFERVMREALTEVIDEIRAARPGPFSATLRWQDLRRDRLAVGVELHGVEWSMATPRVHGFSRTLQRRRDVEGGDEADDAALARRLSASYFHHRDRDPALFSDTLPCLDALEPRYRLGLLSNGSRLPEKVGLGRYFEAVVFGQDHRVAKPDKGIFEAVERQLGVGPAACVLVGDHPLNDVAGAKRADWRAVWIEGDGEGAFTPHLGYEEQPPDAVVTTLADVPGALERLGSDGSLSG